MPRGLTKARSGNPIPWNALLPEDRALVQDLVASEELAELSPRELSFIALEKHDQYISHVAIWQYMRERGIYDTDAGRKRTRRCRCTERPDTAFAEEPNQLWCWDISHLKTFTPGEFFYLYAIEDWVSRKVVAWHLSESLASSEVFKVWDMAIVAEELLEMPRCLWPVAMSDRGTQMRSRATRRYFKLWEIDQLFGRPRTPNDNPKIEALFATLKTRPFYPDRFASFAEALRWCEEFFDWYNNRHHHRSLGYVTPAQRHSGEHVRILEERRRRKSESMSRRHRCHGARAEGSGRSVASVGVACGAK